MTPTDMNPVDELLAAESDRDRRARELGSALTALLDDVETYRRAWSRLWLPASPEPTFCAWASFDPAKLPRPRRSSSSGPAREVPPASGPRNELVDHS